MPKQPRPDSEPRRTVADDQRVTMGRAVDVICDAWPKALEDRQAVGFPAGRGLGGTGGGQSGIRLRREDDEGWETIPATGVEIAAITGTAAVDWLDLAHDTVRLILHAAWPDRTGWAVDWQPEQLRPVLHRAVARLDYRIHDVELTRLHQLANRARHLWPPPPKKGAREGGVTVGERGNDIETCAGCAQPVLGGRADPLKRIDGDPFHVKNPQGTWCYHQALRSRGRLGSQKAAS